MKAEREALRKIKRLDGMLIRKIPEISSKPLGQRTDLFNHWAARIERLKKKVLQEYAARVFIEWSQESLEELQRRIDLTHNNKTMTAETREEKLERLAELRIQKRVHDLRYTEAENLQTYRTGFEDGYDFRREQDNEYASTKAEEEAKEFMKWHNINHRENLQLPDSYYDELYNQYKQQP